MAEVQQAVKQSKKISTVRVKLNSGMAGHRVSPITGKPGAIFSNVPGDEVDVDPKEAERLIERGYASPLK